MTSSSLVLENLAYLGVVFSKSSFSQTAFLICVENEVIGLSQRFSELQALLLLPPVAQPAVSSLGPKAGVWSSLLPLKIVSAPISLVGALSLWVE